MIEIILKEAIKKFNLSFAYAQHRVGELDLGEIAIVVLTYGGHRGQSYDANRYIVDRIKFECPIWKKEFFEDGTSEWGNNSGENSALNYL